MTYIKSNEFVALCYESKFDVPEILKRIKARNPRSYDTHKRVSDRIANYRRKGLLPLTSGNSVSHGEVLKGSSTLYDESGNIKLQWLKSDVPKEQFLEAYQEAILGLAQQLPALPTITSPPVAAAMSNLATLYISNDLHFGALAWDKESGEDYSLEIAMSRTKAAYDYLFECSPPSKVGIVADLGDLLEVDNDKNMTPKSGNILSTDSRYPKILRSAYEALIYAVNKALIKHEQVYFLNIAGK